MEKYLMKARRKVKLHIYPTLAFIAIGVIMAIIGFVRQISFPVFFAAVLVFIGCMDLLYVFNYDHDFCIDYKSRKILGTKQQEKGAAVMEIYFESIVSAEILEKEALAAEFSFRKLPSHALVLRGTQRDTVIPLTWFSQKQREKMLKEVKKIAGDYLCGNI